MARPQGTCGKLNCWLCGFGPAAAAWEKYNREKLESVGFVRAESCGVIFYHPVMDVAIAVHGDDFTLCGLKPDLIRVQGWMRE